VQVWQPYSPMADYTKCRFGAGQKHWGERRFCD
jgi:hypothetical protein